MRSVRSKDTSVEMKVRKMLHRAGYRYRLHSVTLPGKPDIVFPRKKKAIFIHGCFWHQHSKCQTARRRPASNVGYWDAKLKRNVERDRENRTDLLSLGWQSFIVWECELKTPEIVFDSLRGFLGAP